MSGYEPYSTDPKLKYIQLYAYGHLKESKVLKLSLIPERLYRFQPPYKNRLKTLRNKQLFLSSSSKYDDPFDMNGFFFDPAKVSKELNVSALLVREQLAEKLKESVQSLPSVCFSEEISNLPLWASYAKNYEGFAIGYDFRSVNSDGSIVDNLFPIYYKNTRIDLTSHVVDLLRNIEKISDGTITGNHMLEAVFFFINFLKHKDWEYQKEWRLINVHDQEVISGVIPTDIYIGYRSSESTRKRLRNIAKRIGCNCFMMTKTNLVDSEYKLRFEKVEESRGDS